MQLQACDLVPIVEPEVLIDGDYDIYRSSAVSQQILQVSCNIAWLLCSLKIWQQPADFAIFTDLWAFDIGFLSQPAVLKDSWHQHCSSNITIV